MHIDPYENGTVVVVELIDGRPHRTGYDPGAALDGLPGPIAAEIAAWWAADVGGGETRAERWQREQDEQAAAEEAEAAAPPITALQGKLALDDAGLLPAVEAICLTHEVAAVRLYWQTATQWERGHPVISALALELDPPLDEAAIDALWAAAALK